MPYLSALNIYKTDDEASSRRGAIQIHVSFTFTFTYTFGLSGLQLLDSWLILPWSTGHTGYRSLVFIQLSLALPLHLPPADDLKSAAHVHVSLQISCRVCFARPPSSCAHTVELVLRCCHHFFSTSVQAIPSCSSSCLNMYIAR